MRDSAVRRAAAVLAGKSAGVVTRAAGRGGGTALPGLLATRIDPGLVAELAAQLADGSTIVTGTNGKTTTTQMVAAILKAGGRLPLRNRSGSNLMRGIASTLLARAGLDGNLPAATRVGLFEVDEAAMPEVTRAVRPQVLVLLNLFRDQLDRYGEVATVARIWKESVAQLPATSCIVANADDPLIVDVTRSAGCAVTYFGIESTDGSRSSVEHSGDVKACPHCGGPMEFSVVFLGHQGHYRCTLCDLARPQPEVRALDVTLHGLDGSAFTLETSTGAVAIDTALPGLYNAYNALAAAAASIAQGSSAEQCAAGLRAVQPAFGRMERLTVEGRTVQIALAKNPAGLNEVVRAVAAAEEALTLLVMLNDDTADGHDVSWIWDADIELLSGRLAAVCFSGRRGADMALRFKYAGLLAGDAAPRWTVEFDTEAALTQALEWTAPGGRLFIIPTYTAMLAVRDVLARLGHVRQFWEDE
jgi:lipid II isoglutaminyl synthase (glutamine-hydrolysing)